MRYSRAIEMRWHVGDLTWGIMGTGDIAGAMVGALRDRGSPVVAVGSARPDAARQFASRWDIPKAVPSHEAVAAIADVDIVYVATTNDRHHQNVLNCIEQGKAVLCEKPIALNARQAGEMFAAALSAGVFIMEALWMRFLPFLAKVDQLISEGTIGKPMQVQASISHPAMIDAGRRWMSAELGGGSLLDLGVYPLSLIHHLLGPPLGFEAKAHTGDTGVDVDMTVISHHEREAVSVAAASFTASLANEAIVSGQEACIRLHAPFYHSRTLTVERDREVVATYDTDFDGHGFRFEVAETERCVGAGLAESPLRPHGDTLAVLEWMDATRSRCGVRYLGDLE